MSALESIADEFVEALHVADVPKGEVMRKARWLSGAGLLRLLTIKPLIGKQERQDRVDRNHGPQKCGLSEPAVQSERMRSMLCLASATASSFRAVEVCKVGCGKIGRLERVR
jgi:hypothetical protein